MIRDHIEPARIHAMQLHAFQSCRTHFTCPPSYPFMNCGALLLLNAVETLIRKKNRVGAWYMLICIRDQSMTVGEYIVL